MKNGQVIRFRGKSYRWNWKGSPIHIAGIMGTMILALGVVHMWVCIAWALQG